jgi:hypothetical protein
MEQAIAEAKCALTRADMLATSLARLLVGRLKKVDSQWVLDDLKRELRAWHIGRGWKETS